MKVLVLDEEHFVTELISEVLRDEGLIVDAFTSPNLALSSIKTTEYDVIITDVAMPDVDGLGIINTAKECNPNAKVIVITGFPKEDIDVLDVYKVFEKPFCIHSVIDVVKGCS